MGKSYYKFMFLLYSAALLFCGGIRIYLKLSDSIDPQTGFYQTDSRLVTLFNIALAAAAILILLANRMRVTDNDYPAKRLNRYSIPLSLLLAVSAALYALECAGIIRFTRHPGIVVDGRASIPVVVLGALTTACFLWMGVRGIAGLDGPPNALLMLFPCVWQIALIVAKFNSYTTLTTISDNLLTVLFTVFAAMFLIGNARTICGFARKDSRNYTLATGLLTSLMGFLLTIPGYLYLLVRRLPTPVVNAPGDMEGIYIFLLSLYALSSVIRLRRSIALV